MIQQTSTQSYQEEKKKGLSDRHKEILGALTLGGPMTDYELAVYLGKSDPNYARPRRNELASGKYGFQVEACPEKRPCKITKKMAIVWRIRKEPLRQLEMFAA